MVTRPRFRSGGGGACTERDAVGEPTALLGPEGVGTVSQADSGLFQTQGGKWSHTSVWPGCRLWLYQKGPALGTACSVSAISKGFLASPEAMFLLCLIPHPSRTLDRRKEAGRRLWYPNLITPAFPRSHTGIWGSKICMLCGPIAILVLPGASWPQVLVCVPHPVSRL